MTSDLHRTTAAVVAADEAHLARIDEGTIWMRKGLLGRLTRVDRFPAGGQRAGRRTVR
jgi:hypothetical protein